jgi:NitT/TauT family transport system permease protein
MPDRKDAVPFRGGGFDPLPRHWASWLAFAAILAGWQVSSATGLLPALFMPSPEAVLGALGRMSASGELWLHLGTSLRRIVLGFLIGAAAGMALGLAMGIFSLARAVGLPIVSALFPIPKIALLPLLILWLGIGEASKVATIALGVFFPMAVAAKTAVDGVARNLIRMGQSFGMPARAIVWKIVLPGALPGVLGGLRIAASIALILVTAAEMIGAEYGVGALVLAAGNLMQTDKLIAGVVLLSLMGLAVSFGIGLLERRLLRWR